MQSVHPCMHHNYGVISERHTSTACVWAVTLVAELCTTCSGEGVVVVIRFNVTFLPLKPYCEKMCTCFLKSCALWCSQIVYTDIRPYSLNTTTAFYFVTECPEVSVSLRTCQSRRHGWVFGGLSPPNWSMKHYKSVGFLSIFRMSSPPHKRKAPYWKFSGHGYGTCAGHNAFVLHQALSRDGLYFVTCDFRVLLWM